ncbi:hypothetical protein B7494_g1920 [Chlorociboria aeruginascens]|nr:hypothetical protein B7494_g1920 [Chlorociboria aeruginascens]
MRPRLPIRRIFFLRPFRPPNAPRPFTQNTLTTRPPRPQLPFLSPPNRRQIARFLTTERKQWIKEEVWQATKYTGAIWATIALCLVTSFGVQEEWMERKFPTPPEWSWFTRKEHRSSRFHEWDGNDGEALIDWAMAGDGYRKVLKRLENPSIDGADLEDQDDGGILVEGVGRTGFDLSKKSEEWRRGYYEALMGAARAAEHLDGWVRDRTRNLAFPANVMIGPSNPDPRPIKPGSEPPPREEDCEKAFEPPQTYYMRVLTTQGFTEKQRMDAALGYAVWLDYKQAPSSALEMYKWAMDIATSSSGKAIVDSASGVLKTEAGNPSSNILTASTALAIHHAANGHISTALPIFISILRARRSLSESSVTMLSTLTPGDEGEDSLWKVAMSMVRSLLVAPKYPPPPDDGTTPPLRTSKERCEEAGIMTYIGEILFTSTNKDDGLAWTREAVDIAEEEFRGRKADKEAKKICKKCLEVGLGNWATMVEQLASAERENKGKKLGGWLGFGGQESKDVVGRWESEEKVVKERMRRVNEEKMAGPKKGFSAMIFG